MVCTISWGVGYQVLDWKVQLAAVALLQGELPRRDHCGGVPREGVPAGAADKDTHTPGRELCVQRGQPYGNGGTDRSAACRDQN